MLFLPKSLLQSLAAMGDGAVIGALAVLIGAYLFWTGCRQGMKSFFFALGLAVGALAFVKLVLLGCAVHIPFLDLRSQAGNAAFTSAVLGIFASVMASQLSGDQQRWPFYILIPFILAIEGARVALGLHDEGSALLGLLIGGNIAFGVHMLFTQKKMVVLDIRLLLVLTLLVVVIFRNFAAELKMIVDRLALWFTTC